MCRDLSVRQTLLQCDRAYNTTRRNCRLSRQRRPNVNSGEGGSANMDATTGWRHAAEITKPRARIGLIIPSVNRMTEPQFNRFAPPDLGIHVARGRVAGEPARTVAELTDE